MPPRRRTKKFFTLANYDCIGFDFDHTIFKYNIKALNSILYKCFVNCIVNDYGYERAIFTGDQSSAHFVQRGLFIDTDRGNFLKLGSELQILRASHGTKMLSRKKIDQIYGTSFKWTQAAQFTKFSKPLSYASGNLCFTDFLTSPIYLLGAQLVDHFDAEHRTTYTFWHDVISVLASTFSVEKLGQSDFFAELISNFPKYAEERGKTKVKEWLLALRKAGKRTFLMTAAPPTYSYAVSEKFLGKNWRDCFDIVCNGYKKPETFAPDCKNAPFVVSTGSDDMLYVEASESVPLASGGIYTGGNFAEMYEFFQRETGKEKPRVVYFGDDFLNDLLGAASFATNCDAVGIIDELAKRYTGDGEFSFPTLYGGDSGAWGSLFYDTVSEGRKVQTFWGKVLTSNTKMLVPSVECFANMPLNHKFRYPALNGIANKKKIENGKQ